MQRTLKREFKELEIVERETAGVSYSIVPGEIQLARGGFPGGRSPPVAPSPGSEPSRAGALFPGGEPASVFLPTRPPSRGARWRGRPKPRGIKICPLLAGGATPARKSTPPGRPRNSSARPPPGGRRHPDPPRGSGGLLGDGKGGRGRGGERGLPRASRPGEGLPSPPIPSLPPSPSPAPFPRGPGPGTFQKRALETLAPQKGPDRPVL